VTDWGPDRREGNEMSSGAYALYVDQSAGGGPNGIIERVIPVPPTFNQGNVSFNHGWLSLAYDNFGTGPATIIVRVRVLNGTPTATVRSDTMVTLPVGRTVVTQIQSGDRAVSVQYPPQPAPPAQPVQNTVHPVLAAFIEFND
jgi:hypothetical protein